MGLATVVDVFCRICQEQVTDDVIEYTGRARTTAYTICDNCWTPECDKCEETFSANTDACEYCDPEQKAIDRISTETDLLYDRVRDHGM